MRPLYVLLLIALPLAAHSSEGLHPSDLPAPAPVDFDPPQPEIVKLKNGMTLYLLEDHELPLFNIGAYIRAGSAYEPADKLGLAGLTATVMRSGGSATRPGDQLDEELSFIAGSVEVGMSNLHATASVDVLAKHIDTGLEIFADLLMHPALPADKLELARAQRLEGIRRQNDNPVAIASREFYRRVYGADSPWGRSATVQTVSAITRQDLVDYHAAYFRPDHMTLAVVGDFKKKDIVKKIKKAFKGWKKGKGDLPGLPALEEPAPGVFHIEKDVNQATIYIGHLGIKDLNPDWYAVRIMNRIYGIGTFTSRLGREIRVNRGLAYSVGGGVTRGPAKGPFYIRCQTKNETAVEAIQAMLQITRDMRQGPIGAEEFGLSQSRLINSDIFNYDSSVGIANQRVYYDYYGFAPDYLSTFVERTQAVTPEDALRVAQAYMHPDKAVVVIVGRSADFDQELSVLGEVTRVELEAAE